MTEPIDTRVIADLFSGLNAFTVLPARPNTGDMLVMPEQYLSGLPFGEFNGDVADLEPGLDPQTCFNVAKDHGASRYTGVSPLCPLPDGRIIGIVALPDGRSIVAEVGNSDIKPPFPILRADKKTIRPELKDIAASYTENHPLAPVIQALRKRDTSAPEKRELPSVDALRDYVDECVLPVASRSIDTDAISGRPFSEQVLVSIGSEPAPINILEGPDDGQALLYEGLIQDLGAVIKPRQNPGKVLKQCLEAADTRSKKPLGMLLAQGLPADTAPQVLGTIVAIGTAALEVAASYLPNIREADGPYYDCTERSSRGPAPDSGPAPAPSSSSDIPCYFDPPPPPSDVFSQMDIDCGPDGPIR